MGGKPSTILKVTGISLVSGGLDSILAVKVLQEQDIDVIGVAFETPFFNARRARLAAEELGIPLLVLDITDDHMVMLRAPRYGYGKNLNPCIDCHMMMLAKAGEKMRELGADFLSTGEVLGQRPMSQNKQSLHIVASRSGYGDYIIRPLSARLLPETIPEKEGKVDRERLLDIQGRSRKRQLEMAANYGIKSFTSPAGGCLLTDPGFARRLKDLLAHDNDVKMRDIELLKFGRHLRFDEDTKILIGRKERENKAIEQLSESDDCLVKIRDYPGPTVLIPGGCDEETLQRAAAFCAQYSDAPEDTDVVASCRIGNTTRFITVRAAKKEEITSLMI